MPVYPWSVGWRDARGFVYYTAAFLEAPDLPTANTQAHTLVDALAGISNANGEKYRGCLLGATVPAQRGNALDYADGATRLVYSWQDAFGMTHRWRIPAPSFAVFLPDGVTMDSANAAIVGLNVAMVTGRPCSRAGVLWQLTLGGILERGKQRRRLSQDVLNPALSNQG